MKDKSNLQGIKELHGDRQSIQLHDNNGYWGVYLLAANSWLFECNISQIANEGNEALFNRTMDEIFDTPIEGIAKQGYDDSFDGYLSALM